MGYELVDGVRISAPMGEHHARLLQPLGLFADDPKGLLSAWLNVEAMWAATVDRARALPPAALDQGVGGEWSFLQTMRHMVFVTDVWLRDVVQELPQANHPLGIPPDFALEGASQLGLTIDATPSADEVLAVRAGRQEQARDLIAWLTAEELDRTCRPRDGRFTVLGAVQTVVFEEWAHCQYANRDLAALEPS
jgi:hypothetical protein